MLEPTVYPSIQKFRKIFLLSGVALLVSWGCTGSGGNSAGNGDTQGDGDGDGDAPGDGDGDGDTPGDGDGDMPGDGDGGTQGDGDGDGDTPGDGDGDTPGDGDGDTPGDGDGDTPGDGDGDTPGDGDGDTPGDGDGDTPGDGDGDVSASGGQTGTGGTDGSGGQQGTGGEPAAECDEGYESCDDECVDVLNDINNCGGCGAICPSNKSTFSECDVGDCIWECATNWDDCDTVMENGCETDLLSDKNNCGACGTSCDLECKKGACVEFLTVFVTSKTFTGNLGGIAGADAKCQALAEAEGLSGTFLAWLSDSNTTPWSRFYRSEYPYRLTDGTLVAKSWSDLVDGTLEHPINLTETGVFPPNGTTPCAGGGHPTVWTATAPTGLQFGAGGYNCDDWTSTAAIGAAWGVATASSGEWTSWCTANAMVCNAQSSLYCFQEPPF
jgi:hypothetical protein